MVFGRLHQGLIFDVIFDVILESPVSSTFYPPLRTLMGPGPSDVSPRVLAASARPTIGHLDPLFVGLMDDVKRLLQFAFQTQNELTIPLSLSLIHI